MATSNLAEAAERFSRFLDRPAQQNAAGRMIRVERGGVQLVSPEALLAWAPRLAIPALPFIGMYGVIVRSLAQVENVLRRGEVSYARNNASVVAYFPDDLGIGAWMFVERSDRLPWR